MACPHQYGQSRTEGEKEEFTFLLPASYLSWDITLLLPLDWDLTPVAPQLLRPLHLD
jgi:hypothetical protein